MATTNPVREIDQKLTLANIKLFCKANDIPGGSLGEDYVDCYVNNEIGAIMVVTENTHGWWIFKKTIKKEFPWAYIDHNNNLRDINVRERDTIVYQDGKGHG